MEAIQQFSTAQLREWQAGFSRLRSFPEKLDFLHRHFGVVPAGYPTFSLDVPLFADADKMNTLVVLFEEERRKMFQPDWRFDQEDEQFVFHLSLNGAVFPFWNQFIIDTFLQNDMAFISLYKSVTSPAHSAAIQEEQLRQLSRNLHGLQQQVADRSFHWQFVNVFLRGYHDHYETKPQAFSSRKKFTELFLYAQGIMYARLQKQLEKVPSVTVEWIHKMDLVNSLGIIDFLRKRFAHIEFASHERKLAETLAMLTGERNTGIVLKYLRDNTLI